MNILNLVRCSAYSSNQVNNCLATLLKNDSIILLDDGCYNVTHACLSENTNDIYVINEHALARALTIPKNITAISMNELDNLFFTHNSVVTWQ